MYTCNSKHGRNVCVLHSRNVCACLNFTLAVLISRYICSYNFTHSELTKKHSWAAIKLITEHTECQFPKEHTLCYFENRVADVTKIDVVRPRKSGCTIFPPKDRRNLPKEYDDRLFCLFRESRIDGIRAAIPFIPESEQVPKEHNYCQFRVFSFRNSPKRTRPCSSLK